MSTSSPSGNGEAGVPLKSILGPAKGALLADEVVDRLRETILHGHLAPGTRLREEHLADALETSRGPVRGALLQLEREGLVVRRPNRGAVVASLSRVDLEEVYSLRLAVEPLVCRWAARNAVADDLAGMKAVIEGYAETLTTTVSDGDAAEADLRFHDLVYSAARHKRLLRLWYDLRPQVYVFLLSRTYVRTPEFRHIMVSGHGAILSVIASGDEDRAAELARDHVNASYLRVAGEVRD